MIIIPVCTSNFPWQGKRKFRSARWKEFPTALTNWELIYNESVWRVCLSSRYNYGWYYGFFITYLHIFVGIIFEDQNSVIFHALSDTQCNINIKFAEFRVRVPYPSFSCCFFLRKRFVFLRNLFIIHMTYLLSQYI